MLIAYGCIIVAACLPYLWAVLAKTSAPGYNNKDPRGWVARQESYRVRNAYSAHLNAFEAFAPFASSVLMAQFAAVDDGRVAMLSMAFIAFRILHGIFYITGTQAMRSLVWLGGFACVAALMISSALNLAP